MSRADPTSDEGLEPSEVDIEARFDATSLIAPGRVAVPGDLLRALSRARNALEAIDLQVDLSKHPHAPGITLLEVAHDSIVEIRTLERFGVKPGGNPQNASAAHAGAESAAGLSPAASGRRIWPIELGATSDAGVAGVGSASGAVDAAATARPCQPEVAQRYTVKQVREGDHMAWELWRDLTRETYGWSGVLIDTYDCEQDAGHDRDLLNTEDQASRWPVPDACVDAIAADGRVTS